MQVSCGVVNDKVGGIEQSNDSRVKKEEEQRTCA